MFGSTNANMINRNIILKIITAVTLISSCFFMASCENNMNDVKALNSKQGGIDIGKDVAIYVSDNGKMSAKLMAPIMKKYLVDSGKMVEFPNTIKVDFYKDSNIVDSKLSADYANFKQEENKIFLRGNVVVYNVQGDTLWCKEMFWDQNTGKFHTNKEVVVKQHSPISKIYGLGLEANQDLTDITIIKPQSNSFAIISDSAGLKQ
jgi:LPS export ABC transporter protein LptC